MLKVILDQMITPDEEDTGMSERAPWGDFPPVLRNGELGSLKLQPEYEAAKGGDRAAALAMVSRLVTHEFLDQMREQLAGRKPVLVPVLAVEQGGLNKIPLAFARVVGHHLGLPVATEIGMREKVGRTNSGSDHRLVACPSFAGEVEAGQEYVILDDTVSMGGTLAALRGFIENRGGNVILAAAMTAHEGALSLAVKQRMLDSILAKHGPEMGQLCQEELGYDLSLLTQGEAGHFRAAASVEAMRLRLHDARDAARQRMDAASADATEQQSLNTAPAPKPGPRMG